MSEELKPCPFCGSKAVICKNVDKYYVECSNYMCKVRPSTFQVGFDKCIEDWNTRAGDNND